MLPIRQWHHVFSPIRRTDQYDDRVQIYMNGEPQRLKVQSAASLLVLGPGGQPTAHRWRRRRRDALQRGDGRTTRLHCASRCRRDRVLACADSLDRIAAIPEGSALGTGLKMRGAFLDKARRKRTTGSAATRRLERREEAVGDELFDRDGHGGIAATSSGLRAQARCVRCAAARSRARRSSRVAADAGSFPKNRLGLAKLARQR